MKKIKLLSIMLLMSAVAMAADYTAIQLTFQRAGTDVAVTVNDQDGKAISGVTASLESTSFNNVFMTTGAEGITSGQVLAPSGSSTYSNGANAEITYLFKVEGLDGTFSYNSADIDVYGMNKSGNPQSEMERIFHFYVSAGTTENVEDFAVKKEENTTICVSNKNLGLNYTVQNLSTSSEVKTASSPLYIQVKLKKVSSDGCYAGIGAVRLYAKYYTFHRNGNTSAYIYQNSNKMSTGALDNLKMFWWILEPTDNPDRYYIKNATTGKYIQSSKDAGESQLVQMGATPVEYEVKKNGNYYYLASTDQTIRTDGDYTLGLNFGQQGVVAYWIKTSRANSYWELEEREYTYKPFKVTSSEYAKSIQVYSIPCGTKSTYLTSATIAGDDVLSELNYTASAAPANYHVIYVDQKAEVKQGGTLPLTVTVSNNSSEIRMFAYADWDRDGVFEASQEIIGGTATFEVPAEAKLGQCRFRVRVTETDTEGSEDDVIGTCYDFLVNVVDSSKEIEWTVEVNNPARGIASGEEITNGEEKFLKATVKPIGDAVFKGWKLMHSYFKGEIIGTDTEIEVPLTQSLRLVAVLEPNTKITETVKETTYSTMYYSNVALKVPEGVTAYTYKLEGGELAKSKTYNTDDIIPAGEPVVLYDNDETIRNYDFPIVTSNATPDPDNLLLGFDEAQTTVGPRGETSGYKFYKFSFKGRDANNKPQNVGFYYGASKGAAFTSAAHKAYLAVSQDVTGSAKQFLSIPEDFNETTGIQTIEDARADAAVYTLQGIKVNTNGGKLPKGIYIINNKKEIVK